MRVKLSRERGQGGTERIVVGGKTFRIPAGSIVELPRDPRGAFGWVLDPQGRVRAFVAAGEVDVPDEIASTVRREVFGLQ
ncbi:hypothetical protein EDF39_1953 [Frondihabitans sp. PhB161]|nr:hypothetical protein EDF37_2295 [Frondihabitans sp. PhB153]RPF05254.1 hypothetical protein EDF39_1953 [Frondihabitans sp. PhB161]